MSPLPAKRLKCPCGRDDVLVSQRMCSICTYEMEHPWAAEESKRAVRVNPPRPKPKQKETLFNDLGDAA